MEASVLTTHELNQLIATKAGENEEFRLALLSDPIAALEKEFEGVKFPEGTKVKVHVESVDTLHLIIPAANVDELPDDQLESVAGGIGGGYPMLSIVAAYGMALPGGGAGWNWPK